MNQTRDSQQGALPDNARCLDCGYMLRGLPNSICPECGRKFSTDPATYRSPASPWWHRWATAPPRWLNLLALLMLVVLLDLASTPRWSGTWNLPHLLVGGVVAVLFILGPLDYVSRWAAARRSGAHDIATSRRRAARWRWCVVPLCFLIAVSALVFDWPLRVRFALSRPAFERAALDLRSGVPPAVPGWIGLYRVHLVIWQGRATGFFTGMNLRDPAGFEWLHETGKSSGGDEHSLPIAPGWRVRTW